MLRTIFATLALALLPCYAMATPPIGVGCSYWTFEITFYYFSINDDPPVLCDMDIEWILNDGDCPPDENQNVGGDGGGGGGGGSDHEITPPVTINGNVVRPDIFYVATVTGNPTGGTLTWSTPLQATAVPRLWKMGVSDSFKMYVCAALGLQNVIADPPPATTYTDTKNEPWWLTGQAVLRDVSATWNKTNGTSEQGTVTYLSYLKPASGTGIPPQ